VIDPNLVALIAASGTLLTAGASSAAVIIGLHNKGAIAAQGKVIAEVHINTNARLDTMFKMLDSERAEAKDDTLSRAAEARAATVAASTKATADLVAATGQASDRAASHALKAMPPPGEKAKQS